MKIKSSWEDISLEEFTFILQEQKKGLEADALARNVVSHLYDVDADNIPYTDYLAMLGGLNKFIGEKPKRARIARDLEYTINGHTYVLDTNPAAFTTAQYIDFVAMVKDYTNLVGLMSTVLLPKGHGYMDGYDMGRVHADLQKMSAADALGVADFFAKWSGGAMRTILRCLTWKMRKKMSKEERKRLRRLLRDLSRSSASSLT